MNKFEIGDKIRVVGTRHGGIDITLGDIYQVTDCERSSVQVWDDVGEEDWLDIDSVELVTDTPEKPTLDSYTLEELEAMVEDKKNEQVSRWEYVDWENDTQTVCLDSEGDTDLTPVKSCNIRQLITALTNFADDNKL